MGTVDELATKIRMSMAISWPAISWKNCLDLKISFWFIEISHKETT